ncbi:hypothetical protein KC968_02270 [Candidatus Saccharibacteria bacterium]|nr:hypothetical protein [Candidatus Saccharibacteria bacterium]
MNTTLENPVPVEQLTPPSAETYSTLGGLVIGIDQSNEERRIEIAGHSYNTNLPEGIYPFSEHGDQSALSEIELSPIRLDELTDGTYTVTEDPADVSQTSTEPYTRTISIRHSEHGKAIDAKSFSRPDLLGMDPPTARYFSKLGYEFDDDTLVDGKLTPSAIPTPETIKTAAKALGVDIEIFEEGLISPTDYLNTLANGKFPVSGATESYYRHDAAATHLKVMLLGGTEIRSVLADAASRALSAGDSAVREATGAIDKYTDALADIYNELGYCHDSAIELGLTAGISQETTLALIAVIQSRAQEQGINPPPKQEPRIIPQLPG